uniref:Uncharacterized protein n=1 Tax=Caenorhabditis tropicalis TaxID=1561998 RepID=A0A1I7TPE0_9PELO
MTAFECIGGKDHKTTEEDVPVLPRNGVYSSQPTYTSGNNEEGITADIENSATEQKINKNKEQMNDREEDTEIGNGCAHGCRTTIPRTTGGCLFS